jgi:hypothetical protein
MSTFHDLILNKVNNAGLVKVNITVLYILRNRDRINLFLVCAADYLAHVISNKILQFIHHYFYFSLYVLVAHSDTDFYKISNYKSNFMIFLKNSFHIEEYFNTK